MYVIGDDIASQSNELNWEIFCTVSAARQRTGGPYDDLTMSHDDICCSGQNAILDLLQPEVEAHDTLTAKTRNKHDVDPMTYGGDIII